VKKRIELKIIILCLADAPYLMIKLLDKQLLGVMLNKDPKSGNNKKESRNPFIVGTI
jgi:hypothetical protein